MENRNGTFQTKALTVDEIHEVQKAYVDAAVRAKEAGYDGIQLHGCHGYLINQFMSPVYNKRNRYLRRIRSEPQQDLVAR